MRPALVTLSELDVEALVEQRCGEGFHLLRGVLLETGSGSWTVDGVELDEPGTELAKVRRRIGMVSPELQAYLGQDAESLLSAALGKRPELLLLDEPCLNLDEAAARRLRGRVERYLAAHPACAAICVAHRPEDVPAGFTRPQRLQIPDLSR